MIMLKWTACWLLGTLPPIRSLAAMGIVRGLLRTAPAFALALLLTTGSGCGRREPPPESQNVEIETVRRPVRPIRTAQAPTPAEGVVTEGASEQDELGEGFVFRNDRIRKGPWSVSLLKFDRSRSELELTTTFGRGKKIGLSALSEQVEFIQPELGEPLAAVNGDFYRTEHESFAGDPRGLQISRGELISGPSGKTAFWISPDGEPNMGNVASRMKITWPDGETTAFGLNEERHSNDAILYTSRAGSSTRASGGRELILVHSGEGPWLPLRPGETYTAEVQEVRQTGNSRLKDDILVLSIGRTLLPRIPKVQAGALLRITTATSPDLNGVQTAVGGGPMLAHKGKIQSVYSNKASERHPRSALGWNDKFFFFAQVDGRQRGFSVGMTLPELGEYLVEQGCQEVMNLDGGGSSEMWVQGKVVNRPCFGYERNTANGLVLVRTQKVAAQ